MATNSVLAKLAIQISANSAELGKALSQSQSQLKSFTSSISNIAGTLGVAFGVQQVASFAFEVAKLAGEAEGVSNAFDRLPESEALMSRLKDATAGTVSELELMRRTVQATNFGIQLESLPKLLEFAAVRAQQTGQSVDYLVDSIVTGIGRKSPLILDNLGISAIALREKMGGVALATASIGDVSEAVGKIASEELEKMGGFAETSAVKIARLSASWDNFKVVLGNVVTAGGFLEKTLNILSNTLNAIGGDEFTKGFNELLANMGRGSEQLEKFAAAGGKIDLSWQDLLAQGFVRTEGAAKKYEKILAEIAKRQSDFAKTKIEVDPATGLPVGGGTRWVPSMAQKQIDTLDSLQEKVKELNAQFSATDENDKARLATYAQEIIATNARIKAIEDLRKAREAENLTPDSVNAYERALKDLNEELANTNSNDTARIRILSAQIEGYRQAIDHVERLKKSFQGLSADTLKVPDLSGLLNPIKEIQVAVGGVEFTKISDSMTEVTARFEAGMKKLVKVNKDGLTEVKDDTLNLGPLVANGIAGIAEALGNAAVGAGNFGKDIIKVVAGFAKQLGEILIATGIGALALKKALFSNPIVAIVAGAALVALASAAGAAASKAHSSAFGGSGSSGRTTSNVTTLQGVGVRPEDRIESVKFEIEGTKLIGVMNNANYKKDRTG